MAQEMFAACSFAFIRSTAMLEERLSNSGLVSKDGPPLGGGDVRRESAAKKLFSETWPNWLCWLEKATYPCSAGARGEGE